MEPRPTRTGVRRVKNDRTTAARRVSLHSRTLTEEDCVVTR
jgi:hypothetical protein